MQPNGNFLVWIKIQSKMKSTHKKKWISKISAHCSWSLQYVVLVLDKKKTTDILNWICQFCSNNRKSTVYCHWIHLIGSSSHLMSHFVWRLDFEIEHHIDCNFIRFDVEKCVNSLETKNNKLNGMLENVTKLSTFDELSTWVRTKFCVNQLSPMTRSIVEQNANASLHSTIY